METEILRNARVPFCVDIFWENLIYSANIFDLRAAMIMPYIDLRDET